MAHSTAQHGGMDIEDQRGVFHGFLSAIVWTCAHTAMAVALLTVAFAIGAGWWAGLMAYLAIGALVGLVFKLTGVWWASLTAQIALLGLGGIVFPALMGMMG